MALETAHIDLILAELSAAMDMFYVAVQLAAEGDSAQAWEALTDATMIVAGIYA